MNQKIIIALFLAILLTVPCFGQVKEASSPKARKGSAYAYWGYNLDAFSKSNLHFSGTNYDFTLTDVVAKDKQAKFDPRTYFTIKKFSIPQYNFRIGYFIKEDWDISFGIDHMKYVVLQDQEVSINGSIRNISDKYNGEYSGEAIALTRDFLKFEHTDGLNYLNVELRHNRKLLESEKIKLSLIEGLGIGAIVPRTNTTLLNKTTYDEFHLSGYGFSPLLGLSSLFFSRFFLQSEIKGGFIHLPKVRTTQFDADKASHSFFFVQMNMVFGYRFYLRN